MSATIIAHRTFPDRQEVVVDPGSDELRNRVDELGFETSTEEGYILLRFAPVLTGVDAPQTGAETGDKKSGKMRELTEAEQQKNAAVESLRLVEQASAFLLDDGKQVKTTVGKSLAELEK